MTTAGSVPGDAGEATARQAAAARAQRYADGLYWITGVSRCQWRQFECTTTWHDVVGEKPPPLVVVRAGAVFGRGIVQVDTWAWEPWGSAVAGEAVSSASYRAPRSAGALTIHRAAGAVLNLYADDGKRLYFDVQARRFVTHP